MADPTPLINNGAARQPVTLLEQTVAGRLFVLPGDFTEREFRILAQALLVKDQNGADIQARPGIAKYTGWFQPMEGAILIPANQAAYPNPQVTANNNNQDYNLGLVPKNELISLIRKLANQYRQPNVAAEMFDLLMSD